MIEETQSTIPTPEPPEKPQSKAKKNLAVMVSFMIVLLIASVVVIARLYPHTRQDDEQTTTQAKTKAPFANMMHTTTTPTPTLDVSNAQLDKDLQDAQGDLSNLDTELNSIE